MAHREGIREFLKDINLNGLKVVDWGCGTKPIKNYLKGGAEYFSIDKLQHVGADLVGNIDEKEIINKLPHFNYEVAFCLEVLEHVDYPEITIQNIHKSLKIGGLLFLSVPFLYPIHSDEDLWRFTDQGIERLLTRNGFKNIEIVPTTPQNNGWVAKAIKMPI